MDEKTYGVHALGRISCYPSCKWGHCCALIASAYLPYVQRCFRARKCGRTVICIQRPVNRSNFEFRSNKSDFQSDHNVSTPAFLHDFALYLLPTTLQRFLMGIIFKNQLVHLFSRGYKYAVHFRRPRVL